MPEIFKQPVYQDFKDDHSPRATRFVQKHILSKLVPGKVTLLTSHANNKESDETLKITALLEAQGLDYQIIDLSKVDSELKHHVCLAIQMDTGYYQLPSIYFGHEHIGGLDDFKAYISCDNTLKAIIGTSGVLYTDSPSESEQEYSSIET